jgi:hypothetical protein
LKPISPTRLWLSGLVREQTFQSVVVMAVLLALLVIVGQP